ncbi:hypothetical protein SAMN04487895_101714 [Paenibacillus sophorae]|uniref:Uncharacterized protein n=1 Tax=Paenibacillus sophorae TaxID=1333845 RepID=A0A1H8H178_9BACL|nr:hypothetical protein [Paenibacillus sophorae]QWU14404.1 hypothetical protein KP014_21080 [Paenibacillus sophorae]SEN49769.1 hypothetical protein SAMN04487895_101714 [Paenibacillus sophorae]
MNNKTIKLVKRDGSLIIKTSGDNLKVLELCTCCMHDVVSYQGNTVEIVVSA